MPSAFGSASALQFVGPASSCSARTFALTVTDVRRHADGYLDDNVADVDVDQSVLLLRIGPGAPEAQE